MDMDIDMEDIDMEDMHMKDIDMDMDMEDMNFLPALPRQPTMNSIRSCVKWNKLNWFHFLSFYARKIHYINTVTKYFSVILNML